MTKKLTGDSLSKQAKKCIDQGMGLSATAIDCGYFNEVEDKKIPATNTFQRELLKAAGFDFGAGRQMMGDTVKMNANQTIVISPTRVKEAGLKPGDELEISFQPTTKGWVLRKLEKPTEQDDW